MRRSLATKLAVILAVIGAFLWYRQHKNVKFSHELLKARPALVSTVKGNDLKTVRYEDASTVLWSDRPYHTNNVVDHLVGKHFIRTPRNWDRPYLLHVLESTTLFTLANKQELNTMTGWERVDEEVLVDDAYPPRRMDVMLKKNVTEGELVIQPVPGGPAQPVFFDPELVKLTRDGDHR